MASPTEDLTRRLLIAAAAEAGESAEALLRDARAEAEDEVKELLKSAWKAALLRRAVASLEAESATAGESAETPMNARTVPTSTAPARESRETDPQRGLEVVDGEPPQQAAEPDGPADDSLVNEVPEEAWYVYGVVEADRDFAGESVGVGPGPLRGVAAEGLVAVTSVVDAAEFRRGGAAADLDWLGSKAEAHDRVLSRLADAGPVVPFRFGTLARSEADVRRLLRRHREALGDRLEALRGRREWGVKIYCSADRLAERLTDLSDPGPVRTVEEHGGGTGTTYLTGKRRGRERAREAERLAAGIVCDSHERLAAAAADSAELPVREAERDGAPQVFNGAYLVSEGDEEEFRRRVGELAEEYGPLGVAIDLTGPWPAYSFSSLELAAEAAS